MQSLKRALSVTWPMLVVCLLGSRAPALAEDTRPLKLFLLGGQSNMEGHGQYAGQNESGTLAYLLANDSENKYQYLQEGNGDWVIRDDVWHTYEPGDGGTIVNSGLTVGQGVDDTRIGPELGIGHVLGDYLQNDVLLIKTAWGGAALGPQDDNSFNPPSSDGATGNRFTSMIAKVKEILGDVGRYYPGYDDGGYELAGFFWHQGWNDHIDDGLLAAYTDNLNNLILDVRSELGIEELPVVVGLTGMQGWIATHPSHTGIWEAQFAITDYDTYPDFEDNVSVAETRHAWMPVNESVSDAVYHWNRNGQSYFLLGNTMGEAMKGLLSGAPSGIVGCTEENDENYSQESTIPCETCCADAAAISGCMDPNDDNYNDKATVPCENCCQTVPVNQMQVTYDLSVSARGKELEISIPNQGDHDVNLYTSRGVKVDEKRGLGPVVYRFTDLAKKGLYIVQIRTGQGVMNYKVALVE